MNIYKKTFVVLAGLFTASAALAGYDEFDCRSNNMMELSGVACVSCGIQKYYSDKGQEVVPSEKWLALLAVNTRAFRNTNPGSTDDIVRSDIAKENLQKVIISQVQAYGFCKDYLGKNTARSVRSKYYPDMSSKDWEFFNGFITNSRDRNQTELGKAAKEFGFQSNAGLFGNGNKEAYENMRYMMDDVDYRSATLFEKRSAFKEKVNEALYGKKLVAVSGGDDQGLRRCLEEVQAHLNNPPSDQESVKFCATMSNACDIDTGFCSIGVPRVAKPAAPTPVSDKYQGSKPGKLRAPPLSKPGVN